MLLLVLLGLALFLFIGVCGYVYFIYRARRLVKSTFELALKEAYKAGDSWRYKGQ